MKIAIITRHFPINYGSLLQAMALSRVIEKLGHSCDIIDYIHNDERYIRQEKTLLASKPTWNGNPLKRFAYLIMRYPESVVAGKMFEKWRNQYLPLTKHYESGEQLSTDKPTADLYMTGSDQVWGKTANGKHDFNYALSFTGDADRRIAYAASFGSATLEEEAKSAYTKWLSRYEYLSVREEDGVRILNGLGFEARQVLDPTLLLNAEDWRQYCENMPKGKYVLVYQIHSDKILGQYAKKVAKSMGLPLLRISPMIHQILREGHLIWLPSIGKFLSYIKNADCLITDSFHGTAFAINFHVPFVEIVSDNGTQSRNLSLLTLTGLTDRVLENFDDVHLAVLPIDFTQPDEVLREERARSLKFLKNAIEGS